ncbi:MAG: NAD-binding protein [Owenweeksia sp.]|nr:NAD-binding protein [Owenweeksia sp.]
MGYGLNGQQLAGIARRINIPYAIIDLNTNNVEKGKAQGEPIFFGDAANPYVLENLHVYQARVAVVAISDPPATKRVVTAIRAICNTVHIMVRTRFLYEGNRFLRLGASEVISEEFETSVEIFARVLHQYFVPEEEIYSYVEALRNENYEMLRPYFNHNQNLGLPDWHDMKVVSLRIETKDPQLINIPLSEARLRNRYGVSVMAIYRNDEVMRSIDPMLILKRTTWYMFLAAPRLSGNLERRQKLKTMVAFDFILTPRHPRSSVLILLYF